jgi:hypothetical protein
MWLAVNLSGLKPLLPDKAFGNIVLVSSVSAVNHLSELLGGVASELCFN